MVAGGGGPQLPFAQTFASSAIAACTAEVSSLKLQDAHIIGSSDII